VIGGPVGDCGLTGRKIIVDTYGGMARHGGGAFSGKDPSKVDRSAAYAARYVAKNIVAAGLADRCEVQVSYAIGVAEPTSISVTTFGTGKIADDKIEKLIRAHFDLRPYGIIQMLDLDAPDLPATAAYGHFGRKPKEVSYTDAAGKKHAATAFSWEKTDRADALRRARQGQEQEVASLTLCPPLPLAGEGWGEGDGPRMRPVSFGFPDLSGGAHLSRPRVRGIDQSSRATNRPMASSMTLWGARSTLRALRATRSSMRILFTRATPCVLHPDPLNATAKPA
jgi:hypothetical protein